MATHERKLQVVEAALAQYPVIYGGLPVEATQLIKTKTEGEQVVANFEKNLRDIAKPYTQAIHTTAYLHAGVQKDIEEAEIRSKGAFARLLHHLFDSQGAVSRKASGITEFPEYYRRFEIDFFEEQEKVYLKTFTLHLSRFRDSHDFARVILDYRNNGKPNRNNTLHTIELGWETGQPAQILAHLLFEYGIKLPGFFQGIARKALLRDIREVHSSEPRYEKLRWFLIKSQDTQLGRFLGEHCYPEDQWGSEAYQNIRFSFIPTPTLYLNLILDGVYKQTNFKCSNQEPVFYRDWGKSGLATKERVLGAGLSSQESMDLTQLKSIITDTLSLIPLQELNPT